MYSRHFFRKWGVDDLKIENKTFKQGDKAVQWFSEGSARDWEIQTGKSNIWDSTGTSIVPLLYSTREKRQSGYRVKEGGKKPNMRHGSLLHLYSRMLMYGSTVQSWGTRLTYPFLTEIANCTGTDGPLWGDWADAVAVVASDVKWMVLGKHMSSRTFIPSPCTINQQLGLRTVEQVFIETVMSATVKRYNDTAHYSYTKRLLFFLHLGMQHRVTGALYGQDGVLVVNKACLSSLFCFFSSANSL